MAYKILVVDDEMMLLNTVRAYLEQAGYTVQTATDGRSALHTFRDFHPDLGDHYKPCAGIKYFWHLLRVMSRFFTTELNLSGRLG
jgi:CheY-like chemotaxis protein